MVLAFSCGTESTAVEDPTLNLPMPNDQEASRRMFSRDGMPQGWTASRLLLT